MTRSFTKYMEIDLIIIECINLLNVLKVYAKLAIFLEPSTKREPNSPPSDDFSNTISVKLIKI